MIQHQFDWQQNKNSSQGRAEWTTCTHATANAVEGQRAFGRHLQLKLDPYPFSEALMTLGLAIRIPSAGGCLWKMRAVLRATTTGASAASATLATQAAAAVGTLRREWGRPDPWTRLRWPRCRTDYLPRDHLEFPTPMTGRSRNLHSGLDALSHRENAQLGQTRPEQSLISG